MNQRANLLTTLFLMAASIATMAQSDCGLQDGQPSHMPIFGPVSIVVEGRDTVETIANDKIIYSCWDCTLTCSDSDAKLKWTKDLSELDCQLVTMLHIARETRIRVRGCDIVFQVRDHTLYGLNSKNGRVKRLTRSDIEKTRRKVFGNSLWHRS